MGFKQWSGLCCEVQKWLLMVVTKMVFRWWVVAWMDMGIASVARSTKVERGGGSTMVFWWWTMMGVAARFSSDGGFRTGNQAMGWEHVRIAMGLGHGVTNLIIGFDKMNAGNLIFFSFLNNHKMILDDRIRDWKRDLRRNW